MRRSELWRNICFNLGLVSIVMLLIIFIDLVTAMVAGLILELLHFLIKSSKSLVRHQLGGGVLHSNVVRDDQAMKLLYEKGEAIQVITLQGTLFFGNTGYLASYLDAIPAVVTTVLIDFKRVSEIDSSGVLGLSKIDRRLTAQNMTLLLTGLPSNGEMQLADTVPFAALTENDLQTLTLERREFDTDALIIRQGEQADGFYVLVKGRVGIIKNRQCGAEHSLVEFGPGVNIGEMAIFGGGLRTANVQARSPAVLHFMSLAAFEQLCVDQPSVAVTILKNIAGSLSRRLAETSRTISELESA